MSRVRARCLLSQWCYRHVQGQRSLSAQPMVLPLCPQYQELQASAQLQGDSMREAQLQISQLRQAIQRLQSQIVSLKKQVGSQCPLQHPPTCYLASHPSTAKSSPSCLEDV